MQLANDMFAAYKVLGQKPPTFLEKYTNNINEFARSVPVSNLANMFPL